MNSHDEVWYLAGRKLKITNGPGVIPSTVTIEEGERFALDGDEQNDFERLLKTGVIRVYGGTPEEDAFIEAKQLERAIAAAKPTLKKRRK